MKFVYLRKNSNLTVLNMGYKLDLLQPKQRSVLTLDMQPIRDK